MKNTMPTFKPTNPYITYGLNSALVWEIIEQESVRRRAIKWFNRYSECMDGYSSFALTDIRTGEVLRQVWR